MQNRVTHLQKTEDKLLHRIQLTRERASKLSSQRALNEAAFLDKLKQRHSMQEQLDHLRESHLLKRFEAESSRLDTQRQSAQLKNELQARKAEERKQYSQLREAVESEHYEGKLARKMRVHEGQRRLKEKIEQIETLKGNMRRERYQSRVSLNQSRIEQMSEQIVQLVRKESNLIERLKDTKGVEERAV